jgi:hypothetical protein
MKRLSHDKGPFVFRLKQVLQSNFYFVQNLYIKRAAGIIIPWKSISE